MKRFFIGMVIGIGIFAILCGIGVLAFGYGVKTTAELMIDTGLCTEEEIDNMVIEETNNETIIKDEVIVEEEIIEEEIIEEEPVFEGKVSKEYLEEVEFNSQKNTYWDN